MNSVLRESGGASMHLHSRLGSTDLDSKSPSCDPVVPMAALLTRGWLPYCSVARCYDCGASWSGARCGASWSGARGGGRYVGHANWSGARGGGHYDVSDVSVCCDGGHGGRHDGGGDCGDGGGPWYHVGYG